MKTKNIIKITAMTATLGFLSPSVILAATSAATATATASAVSVPAYIVTVFGTGWSVGRKTSSVLSAQSGVKKVKLSGMRATVFVEDGATIDKDTLKIQLEQKGLKLVAFQKGSIPKPVAAYVISLSGTGWSETADKVRVALEKVDNVSVAFVNRSVELFLSSETAPNQSEIQNAVNSSGAKFISMEKVTDVSL